MKRKRKNKAALTDRTTIRVRFSEVDAMRIVWHGEYVRYFEDGRESFGSHYGLGYMDICAAGYTVPIVELNCRFIHSLVFGETAVVETRFIDCEAAKIKFEYTIFRESNGEVVAEGESVQVFLNAENQLELVNPPFYLEWKKKHGIGEMENRING